MLLHSQRYRGTVDDPIARASHDDVISARRCSRVSRGGRVVPAAAATPAATYPRRNSDKQHEAQQTAPAPTFGVSADQYDSSEQQATTRCDPAESASVTV